VTTAHSFKCDPATWDAARARADREHTTVSAVLVAALGAYAAGDDPTPAPMPARPREPRPRPAGTPAVVASLPPLGELGECKHPRARVLRGLCGACGTSVA